MLSSPTTGLAAVVCVCTCIHMYVYICMHMDGLQGSVKAKANQAVRIARGPDGSRGFTAALQPGGRAKLLPPPAPTPPQTPAAPGSEGTSLSSVCLIVAAFLYTQVCCTGQYWSWLHLLMTAQDQF